MISKILVPHDGTEMSDKALQKATELANAFKAQVVLLHVIEQIPVPPSLLLGNDTVLINRARRSLRRELEEAWNKMKNAVKVSLFKPELLKVHNIQQDSEFDFRKYFTEYAMNKPELMEQMKKAALKIPDSVARTAIGVGKPDDVIEMLDRFINAGVNHFIIRFWGDGYFKNIEMFGKKVIPYFREKNKK